LILQWSPLSPRPRSRVRGHVDICRDLGIAPGHLDRAFWDEINHAIMMYGGSLARFLTNLHERLFACFSGEHSGRVDPGWPAASPRLLVSATGPP
jgi:hypothetical protein